MVSNQIANVRLGAPHALVEPMMVDLVEVKTGVIGGREVLTADARSLHAFLGLVRYFADWIDPSLARSRMKEGRDFEVYHANVKNPLGGRPRIEYLLTLDCASHLAMQCDTERGYEAREYFLDCERRADGVARQVVSNAPADPLKMMLAQNDIMRGTISQMITLRADVEATKAAVAEQKDEIEVQKREIATIRRVLTGGKREVLAEAPKGEESLTQAQDRIHARMKLSKRVVERVMRKSPYKLKPSNLVEGKIPAGTEEDPKRTIPGPPYLVYFQLEVTELFDRFASQCQRVSPCKAGHTFFSEPFNLKAGFAQGETPATEEPVDIVEEAEQAMSTR